MIDVVSTVNTHILLCIVVYALILF